MAKSRKRNNAAKTRSLSGDLMSGVRATRDHREGRFTPRSHRVRQSADGRALGTRTR